ncbi:MAG TPA: TRIC cation channel family protein [Candidatus Angelobacter sp.]|nr:TRIC cation channel family protein [Candidatus Angelobacter sp.]
MGIVTVATVIEGLPLALPAWTQLAAVGVGAVSGAVYAAKRGFDVVGVLVLAVAEGLGGLLLRDTLLQTGTSIVLLDGRYLLVASGAAVVGFFFAGLVDRLEGVIVVLDAVALGFFCTVGAASALAIGLSPLAGILIGTATAVGGLVLRDLLAGDAPRVLRPGVFTAAAAFFGALAFVLLETYASLPSGQSQILAMLVVFAVRLLAVRLEWRTRSASEISDRVWSVWARTEDGAP